MNLREENKVSEFHNAEAESKMAEFNMAEIKMATIIKLSQNELVKFFVQIVGREEWMSKRGKTKMAESKMVEIKMAELKMTAIIKLGESKWIWVRLN